MRITGPSTEEAYLEAFWDHQIAKGGWDGPMPAPADRKRIILDKRWGKFPYDGKRELTWHLCDIETVNDLEELWMHRHGTWLEDRKLWRGSNRLTDLARAAQETGFFTNPNNQHTGPYKNYQRWRNGELRGQLEGNEKPTLLEEDDHLDIFDGWGRLLPYLVLVYEGKRFFPFEEIGRAHV